MGLRALRRQHHAVHGERGVRLQAAASAADGPPGCYEDLELADVVVLWGANIADNHPLLAPAGARRPSGRTLVVVDPRVTKTAMIADVHLAVRPRGDVALLNGILARARSTRAWSTSTRPATHVDGLDELLAHLDALDRRAGRRGERHRRRRSSVALARTIGRAERCVLAWTMGVNHSVQGTETVTLLNTLAVLTGNIGRPGAAPFSITGQCNAMGTRETGFTASMPGYRAYDDPAARARAGRAAGASTSRGCPTARGRAYPDIINAVVSGRIKGLWVIAHQPGRVVPEPRGPRVRARAASTCSSCRTGSRRRPPRSPTWCCPPRSGARRTGTYTNSERRVSRVRAAVAPAGRGPDRLRHLPRHRRALGLPRRAVRRVDRPRATPSRSGAGSRPAVRATTAGSPGSASTRPAGCSGRARPTTRRARSAARRACTPTGGSTAPDGRALVHAVEPEPIRDAPRPELPVAAQHRPHGRALAHPHQDRPRRRSSSGWRPRRGSRCTPTTPRALGLRSGDWVRVSSSAGRGRPDPGAGHRDRASGRGVHPVPLGRALRQPAHRRRVRPDQPRAQLQAVRGPGRTGVAGRPARATHVRCVIVAATKHSRDPSRRPCPGAARFHDRDHGRSPLGRAGLALRAPRRDRAARPVDPHAAARVRRAAAGGHRRGHRPTAVGRRRQHRPRHPLVVQRRRGVGARRRADRRAAGARDLRPRARRRPARSTPPGSTWRTAPRANGWSTPSSWRSP